MKTQKTIVYLHGLNSSHRSFNYIIKELPTHTAIRVDYDSHQPLEASILQVIKQLPQDGEISLVGHSLGGVIAALIAGDNCTVKINELVTISAPHGGSKAANVIQWFPGAPAVTSDITPNSPLIRLLKIKKLDVKTLNIFSTGGHLNTTGEPNDSVVTVSSQKSLSFGRHAEVKATHFEVLMHERTVELIKKHLFRSIK
jgi:pimeloyl-ACP methyl ester carboxylesterase